MEKREINDIDKDNSSDQVLKHAYASYLTYPIDVVPWAKRPVIGICFAKAFELLIFPIKMGHIH